MLVLPNMGLYAWNHTLDPYDSAQLAGNFARLDDHDHSPGKGKRIGTAGIQDGAITPPKLAVGAIGTDNINDSAVTTAKIADGSVTQAKLAAGFFPYALASSSTQQTLTTSFADLTGVTLSITPPVPSVALIMAVFDFDNNLTSNDHFRAEGQVLIDGVAQSEIAVFQSLSLAGNSIRNRGTVSQNYVVSLTAAAHTVKSQARVVRVAGSSGDSYSQPGTGLTVILFPA